MKLIMNQFHLIVITVIGLTSCGSSGSTWDDSSRDEYMKSCLKSLSQDVCECSLKEIEKSFKPSDIRNKGDQKVIEGIRKVTSKCMGL